MLTVVKGLESFLAAFFLLPVYHTSLICKHGYLNMVLSCVAIMHWKNKHLCKNNFQFSCEYSTLKEVLAAASSMCFSPLLVVCTVHNWGGQWIDPPIQKYYTNLHLSWCSVKGHTGVDSFHALWCTCYHVQHIYLYNQFPSPQKFTGYIVLWIPLLQKYLSGVAVHTYLTGLDQHNRLEPRD